MSARIEIGGKSYNAEWFKSRTEEEALRTLGKLHGRERITNVWKQANGKSVPNYTKKKKSSKKAN